LDELPTGEDGDLEPVGEGFGHLASMKVDDIDYYFYAFQCHLHGGRFEH
jgi:hypothetical protein